MMSAICVLLALLIGAALPGWTQGVVFKYFRLASKTTSLLAPLKVVRPRK